MKEKVIVIGTRGSALALWQSNLVAAEIRSHSGGEVRLEIIKTTGDKLLDAPLAKIGDRGLFVKEIELALLEGRVDLAVHSMKDLPTMIPAGLVIAGVLPREDPRDAFISPRLRGIEEIGPRTVIATSSLRRKAQILHLKPGITVVDIRGNVETRVRKIQEGLADASIMALAGLKRMGLTAYATEILSPATMLPAVGQGCIAIETRDESGHILEIAEKICNTNDFITVRAERALMKRLEGGCQVPIGALAVVEGSEILLEAVVASVDGSLLIRDSHRGPLGYPERVGEEAAENLITRGADRILEEIRRNNVAP